jgi:hypothetical protein
MCSGICTTEKKVFQLKNVGFFLFQVFDLRFFTKKFILQQCLNPNPNPNFFSDSDPAKIFGLFRIRIHNTDVNSVARSGKDLKLSGGAGTRNVSKKNCHWYRN